MIDETPVRIIVFVKMILTVKTILTVRMIPTLRMIPTVRKTVSLHPESSHRVTLSISSITRQ